MNPNTRSPMMNLLHARMVKKVQVVYDFTILNMVAFVHTRSASDDASTICGSAVSLSTETANK